MTLDAIKNEITARLREVRADSCEFNASENYNDLQKLITKAIGKTDLCETADDLEAIDGMLTTIEELYNACVAEESGEVSNEILFDFQFELDSDEESLEENQEPEEQEDEEEEIHSEKEEKKALKAQKKFDVLEETKKCFDEKNLVAKLKRPNILRLCIGLVSLFSGFFAGLISAKWWPLEWWAWAITGFGASYLILSLIYAIFIALKRPSAARMLAIIRLILAPVAAIASLVLGIVFEFDLTLLGAYIATIPFTLCGVSVYLVYRIRLFFTACRVRKNKKQSKK